LGFTRKSDWSADEHRMMRAAARHFLTRAAAALIVAGIAAYAAAALRAREHAHDALQAALKADYSRLERLLPPVAVQSELLRPTPEKIEQSTAADPHEREIAEILLFRDRPSPSRSAFLRDQLLAAQPDQVQVIAASLGAHPEQAGLENLKRVLG